MVLGARKPLPVVSHEAMSGGSLIRKAYLVSMTNPKSIAFYGSIFTLMMPGTEPMWFSMAVVMIAVVVSVAWYCGLACLFSHKATRRIFAKAKTGVEATVGAILIGMGGKLLLSS